MVHNESHSTVDCCRSSKPVKPLTVPTLVLYGDSDAALGPQLWKGLDTIVTGAKVHRLPSDIYSETLDSAELKHNSGGRSCGENC